MRPRGSSHLGLSNLGPLQACERPRVPPRNHGRGLASGQQAAEVLIGIRAREDVLPFGEPLACQEDAQLCWRPSLSAGGNEWRRCPSPPYQIAQSSTSRTPTSPVSSRMTLARSTAGTTEVEDAPQPVDPQHGPFVCRNTQVLYGRPGGRAMHRTPETYSSTHLLVSFRGSLSNEDVELGPALDSSSLPATEPASLLRQFRLRNRCARRRPDRHRRLRWSGLTLGPRDPSKQPQANAGPILFELRRLDQVVNKARSIQIRLQLLQSTWARGATSLRGLEKTARCDLLTGDCILRTAFWVAGPRGREHRGVDERFHQRP